MRYHVWAPTALALITIAGPLRAQSRDSNARYNQLRTLTQMDRPGAEPFHLRMETQLYDLKGSPADAGTIEEWWAAPNEYRIVIDSGSIHEVDATGQPEQAAPLSRESYLLHQLLQEALHPLAPLYAKTEVSEEKRDFEGAPLTCLRLHQSLHMEAGAPTFCMDAGTDDLRLATHDFLMAIRNKPGTFHGSRFALNIALSYFGKNAITGNVTMIERLIPGSPGTPALQPAPTLEASASSEQLSRKGSGGHVRKMTRPAYPESARKAQIEGTVLIHAIITTDGKLRSPIVLASPDDALSQAALDAITKWRCDPYRLNGKPTEVSTTVPVIFKLNP